MTRHVLVCRRAAKIKDDLELVKVALACKYGFADEHFPKNAPDTVSTPSQHTPSNTRNSLPNTPQVNSRGVFLEIHEKLGWAVPASDHKTGIIPLAYPTSMTRHRGLSVIKPR